jgi:hypothetical protein
MLTYEEPRCSDHDDLVARRGDGDNDHRPIAREVDQSAKRWRPWRRGSSSHRVDASSMEQPRTAGRWGASDSSMMLGRYR